MTTCERDDLIVNYMPLANKLAWVQKRKVPSFISFDELQSAAYMGLVLAANKFDPSRNISFVHFASFRIFGEIKDYLRSLKTRLEPSEFIEDIAEDDQPEEFFDDIIFCLNGIGKKVITLYYMEGLSMKEIGLQLGVTEGRISQLIKNYLGQIKTWSEKSAA